MKEPGPSPSALMGGGGQSAHLKPFHTIFHEVPSAAEMKSFHLSVVSRRKYPHEFNALKFAETYDRGLNKGALYSAAVLVFVDVVYTPNPYSNPIFALSLPRRGCAQTALPTCGLHFRGGLGPRVFPRLSSDVQGRDSLNLRVYGLGFSP